MAFHPGLSVTWKYYLPFPSSAIEKVVITFTQDLYFILSKTILSKDEIYRIDDTRTYVKIKLTQELSLLFEPLILIYSDVNVYCKSEYDGLLTASRFTSKNIPISCSDQYYLDVIK